MPIALRSRRVRRVALAVAAAAVVLAATVVLLLPWVVRGRIDREARRRGLSLAVGSVGLGFGEVELRDLRCTLDGVSGVVITADRAVVELAGLSPVKVAVDAAQVALEGDGFAADLVAWAGRSPGGTALPLAVASAGVAWREAAGDAPLVVLRDAAVEVAGGAGALRGAHVTVAGRELGAADAGWTLAPGSLLVGLGSATPAAAPLTLVVQTGGARPTATVTLAPTPLAPFGEALGVPLPRVTGEMRATFALPRGDVREALDGSFQASLRGFVPPHPKELDGIVFGTATEASGKLGVSEDRQQARLRDLRVTAGALDLAGSGSLDAEARGAHVRLTLAGAIPCAALARSAAVADLGKLLGHLAGDLARKTLGGNVAVEVTLDGNTADLASARVEKSARVRCKLEL